MVFGTWPVKESRIAYLANDVESRSVELMEHLDRFVLTGHRPEFAHEAICSAVEIIDVLQQQSKDK
jgi:hypothetical protein